MERSFLNKYFDKLAEIEKLNSKNRTLIMTRTEDY